MKSFWLFCSAVLVAVSSMAQGEANNWVFGFGASITFNTLNNGLPTSLPGGQVNVLEGNATISDANGNLLFYTEGIKVWDKNHAQMPNGDGLLGNPSSTQSAIIVPRPGVPTDYYIFTVAAFWGTDGLRYSRVDMTLNGGLGDIDTNEKNIPLTTPTPEKIAAVAKADGSGYWVVSHTAVGDTFLAYSVTSAGVDPNPVMSNTGVNLTGVGVSFLGYLRVSPQGDRLAAVHRSFDFYEVYDFDPQTGVVSNALQIQTPNINGNNTYGLEFSPNGSRLYVCGESNTEIYQYDLTQGTAAAISASEVLIADLNGPGGTLQIGPDKRIYCCRNSQPFLAVIHDPNELGLACNFQDTAVALIAGASSLGLPNFVGSFFNIDIGVEGQCDGDSIFFTIDTTGVDSVFWNFGDPNSGSQNTDTNLLPFHVFSDTGTYTVTAIAWKDTIVDTATAVINIYHYPTVDLGPDTMLCVSDTLVLAPGSPPVSYLWQDSTTTDTMLADTTGLYHVTLWNTCDTVSDSIFVRFEAPLMVDLGVDTAICEGLSYTLDPGLADTLDYLWSDGSSGPTLTLTESDTVVLSIENSCGIFSDTALLEVIPLPFVDLPEDTLICSGDSMLLVHPNTQGIDYSWNDGSGDAELVVSSSGVYWVSAETECGLSSDTIEIQIENPILVELPEDTALCPGDSIEVSVFWAEATYLWSTGDTNDRQVFSEPGLYSVTVSQEQCSTIEHMEIMERREGCDFSNCVVMAPNVFTPDGDGLNDQLVFDRGCVFHMFSLHIFNRWGQLVFSSENAAFRWDGTFNGEPLSEGVYFYRLVYEYSDSFDEHRSGEVQGTVTLIR